LSIAILHANGSGEDEGSDSLKDVSLHAIQLLHDFNTTHAGDYLAALYLPTLRVASNSVMEVTF